MDLTAWATYAFITAAALAATLLHYRRHEPAGRGRTLLAVLRWLAIALIVLLLFDPRVPAPGPGRRGTTAVLVDASLSMRLADPDGVTRWDQAGRIAAELRPDRVLLFGGGSARPVTTDSLDEIAPSLGASRLAPTLRAAVEGGAERIVVITDGGIEDAADAEGVVAASGAAVEVRAVGDRTRGNLGLVDIRAPRWAEVGKEVGVEVTLARVGEGAPDTVAIVLARGEQDLASARVPVPPEGRTSSATLRFTPRSGSNSPVRLDARIEGGDGEAADDRRSVYVRIAAEPPGVVLISFRPDQEPRFLLPVLERSLGVPTQGWLALPESRYIRLGTGREAGLVTDEDSVRDAVEGADVLVLHGLGRSGPAWIREAAASASRLLLFPAGNAAPGTPVEPGTEQPGDWYPSPEVPPSPVAGLMAGADPGGTPPLTALRGARAPDGFWSPLSARLARRGSQRPVLLAGRVGDRRVAVALGEGYWRWAFTGGDGRALYNRMWSAVAGWLAEQEDGTSPAIQPVERAVDATEPLRWTAPAGTDSLRVVLTPEAASRAGIDTVLPAPADTAALAGLPPGRYRYEATGYRAAATEEEPATVTAAGEVTVESFSPELTRPAVAAGLLGRGDGRRGAWAAARGGRPLHVLPWPYAALMLLLCAEWILRRRWGLR